MEHDFGFEIREYPLHPAVIADVAFDVAEGLFHSKQVEMTVDAIGRQRVAGDVRTENFYIYREAFYGDQGPTGEGIFHVNNVLRITVRDTDSVPAILTAALEAGANSVNGVFFDVEDTAGLRSDARALAVENARAVAAELAELLGVQLGDVVAIREGADFSSPQYANLGVGGGGGGGFTAPPVEGGTLGVTVNVEITFELVRQ